MKKVKLFEQFVNEAKMPDKLIGNDEIVFLKTKEDSRGANYNLYYKGHEIEKGGARFGSEKELKAFADDYILSNQLYNKLKYEDSKPLPESFVNEATIPKGMKKQDFKDVIDGDQVELIDKAGKRFGSTTEVDNHEVFWINGKQNRELLKKIGEREFIKQLKKIYDIDVKEVM